MPDVEETHIVLKFSDITTIRHEMNRRAYRFEDLQVGQKVGVESNGIMTNGQVEAIEVIIF